MLPQGGDGAFQVYGVPKDDGGNDQIESAGAVALVLEAAVAQVALPIEEDGAGESVSGCHAALKSRKTDSDGQGVHLNRGNQDVFVCSLRNYLT